MADSSVKPTPIQRNDRDVATELTKFYFDKTGNVIETPEDIIEVYTKIYAGAHKAVVNRNS